MSESNGTSIETNRRFLCCFVEYGSTILYKKWVLDSSQLVSLSEQEKLYRQAGFNSCIGSVDATYVAILACPAWAHKNHKGFKLHVPSRTYNLTVDHSRRILGSTSGHPATWNDKTLILFDELVTKVKGGIIPENFTFKLLKHDKDGKVNEVLYKGVWFMVDNGYLA